MKFTKLSSVNDFENLKKGDILAIKWSSRATNGINKKLPEIMATTVHMVNKDNHEVILNERHNVYFNYALLLENKGTAIEVFLISTKP